ncbi:hypothetical protein [Telluribacter humicola]|uniref:hypothetical protein n=1 Tax=Telluribacter humicola TaxID=1720261 RepID=UPI001A97290C|nr:hypothetical protein [Telluribacter humicola]
MKTRILSLLVACCATLGYLPTYAQSHFLTFYLSKVPPLAPGGTYAVALSDIGLHKPGFSVLLKVRLPQDSVYYTIPGVLPTGDSFGSKVKTGKGTRSDTLYIIHREGESTLQVEEVLVMAFYPIDRMSTASSRREYAKAVLNSYYDKNTKRTARRETAEQLSENKLPDLFPALVPFPTKQSQLVSSQ